MPTFEWLWERVFAVFRPKKYDEPLGHEVEFIPPKGFERHPLPIMREDRPRYMPGSGSRANEIVSGGYTRENMPGYATGAEGEYLPPLQEVEYPHLHMTSGSMLAGAVHFGKYCDVPSKEYMLCIREERDPRKCLREGRDVSDCAFEFFGLVKSLCAREFEEYAECVDHAEFFRFTDCRKRQKPFDECMIARMGIQRPPLGHFSLIRLHHSERPRPLEPEYVLPGTTPTYNLPDLNRKDPPVSGRFSHPYIG